MKSAEERIRSHSWKRNIEMKNFQRRVICMLSVYRQFSSGEHCLISFKVEKRAPHAYFSALCLILADNT